MNTTLINWYLNSGGGGGGSFDADYQAYLDRATALGYTLPTTAHQTLGNQFVLDLKSAGIWSLLDVLWVPAIDNVNLAKLNWKSPSNFQLVGGVTAGAFPPFTANQGFIGNNNDYIKTGWIPSTHGVNYTQNDASIISGTLAETTALDMSTGALDSGNVHYSVIIPRLTNTAFTRINSSTSATAAQSVQASSIHFYHGQRTSSTALKLFIDGSEVSSVSSTSDGVPTVQVYIEAYNNNGTVAGLSVAGSSIVAYGAGLAGKESALYTAWNTYYTGL